MLAKKNRLRSDKDYKQVHERGRVQTGRFLRIKVVANGLGVVRFGLMIGVKVSKKAVERNKVKRHLREAARVLLPSLAPGSDIVVLARPAACDKSLAEILNELSLLLQRAGILKGK